MASSSSVLSVQKNPVFDLLNPYLNQPIKKLPISVFDAIENAENSRAEEHSSPTQIVIHNIRYLNALQTKSPTYSYSISPELFEWATRIGTQKEPSNPVTALASSSTSVIRIHDEKGSFIRKGEIAYKSPDHKDLHLNEIKILWSLPNNNYIVRLLILDRHSRMYLEDAGSQDLFSWSVSHKEHNRHAECRIAKCLVHGLEFLSSSGVVHRDLKLENVVVLHPKDSSNITCKIIDFGFAYRLTEEEKITPPRKPWRGTFTYRVPEDCQSLYWNSPLQVKLSNDIWALGIVLYELYTHTSIITPPPAEFSHSRTEAYNHVSHLFNDNDNRKQIDEEIHHLTTIKATDDLGTKTIKSLTRECLQFDPQKRPSAATLKNQYFQNNDDDLSLLGALKQVSLSSST